MKILVACEESQAVTKEFRILGHEAYSCDIIECSGHRPEWHIMQNVLPLLDGNCTFYTCDGTQHEIHGKWDMIIAFPPCTHLAVSGAAWFESKRKDGRQREAIEFFMNIMNADCEKIAIENPVNIISGNYIEKHFPDLQIKYNFPIKPSQAIQPYEFGHEARKKTCLWLKGLHNLKPTNIVNPGEMTISAGKSYSVGASADTARNENGKALRWNDPETAKIRSKTFQGIAKAMAEQWG
jgi:site-specific DNA-cytosine methylase